MLKRFVRWIENRLTDLLDSKGYISGMKFIWKPATDYARQELVLGPIGPHIPINDLDKWPEYTLSKFADGTKLGAVANAPDSCGAIQRDLDGLEKWTNRSLTKTSKGKCQVQPLGRHSPTPQHRLGVIS